MTAPIVMAVKPPLLRDNRCETCKHFFKANPQAMGECRRNPPQGAMINTGKGMQAVSFYPPTQPDHFCGEFGVRLVA